MVVEGSWSDVVLLEYVKYGGESVVLVILVFELLKLVGYVCTEHH